ncbi:MAG TPA: FAD-dependent monooxygenase [Streptosporangiaceae bacterium]|jgi:2-polyprenyl-6-methoxyphenol hydroxylase-like FAD-dependent oxidoreductase
MSGTSVLISGASVAGTALAYWLDRHGFDVTVVERAPGLRPGGQAIDVRGPALDVADRMGVLEEVRRQSTKMRGMTMVGADGEELFTTTDFTFSGGEMESPDVEILRDDLCRLMHDAATDRITYIFDDSITAIDDRADRAYVTFENAAPRAYDIVVGADGLHSNTRRLAFGPEPDYISHLGMYLAVFTVPNFLGLDYWQIFQAGTDVGGGVLSARDNTEIRAYLGFSTDEPLAYDYRDTDAQRRLLDERTASAGWIWPQVKTYMWDAPDFHLDSMSQIHMDSWSRGRVVLIGDAAYSGSPLSGQGTSMAIVGAYVLAGELAAAGGDHRTAFARYDDELRDYVTANQALALTNKAQMDARTAELTGGEAPDLQGVPDPAEVYNSLKLKDY